MNKALSSDHTCPHLSSQACRLGALIKRAAHQDSCPSRHVPINIRDDQGRCLIMMSGGSELSADTWRSRKVLNHDYYQPGTAPGGDETSTVSAHSADPPLLACCRCCRCWGCGVERESNMASCWCNIARSCCWSNIARRAFWSRAFSSSSSRCCWSPSLWLRGISDMSPPPPPACKVRVSACTCEYASISSMCVCACVCM